MAVGQWNTGFGQAVRVRTVYEEMLQVRIAEEPPKNFCWKRIVPLLNKTARHNYSLPGMRVSGSFASTAHVWGSCQLSVDRYSATSSAGNDSAIALTAAWILSDS